jgi:hypothetical protein
MNQSIFYETCEPKVLCESAGLGLVLPLHYQRLDVAYTGALIVDFLFLILKFHNFFI